MRKDIPLSIPEARLVAEQIRRTYIADRSYWPWVIEELCKRVEELEAEKKEKASYALDRETLS